MPDQPPPPHHPTIWTAVDPRTLARLRGDVAQLTRPLVAAHRGHARHWPSLLDQLRAATATTASRRGPERRPTPHSKPPGNTDAIDRLHAIETGISHWATRLRLWPTGPHHACPTCARAPDPRWPETALQRMAGAAEHLAGSIAQELADDTRTWLRWCCAHTGWTPEQLDRLR